MLGKFINVCEDSLSAAVFTHLLHLPAEVFWRIMRNACYTEFLPENAGEPLSVEFWPNWNPRGTDNPNRVVPDVFIRFTSFDLIIEAKRWDSFQQRRGQWENEVIAYSNQFPEENIPVRMLALGGIWDSKDDEIHLPTIRCPVHMCKWERVLTECQRMKKELECLKYPSSYTQSCIRILQHLIDLFGWHGYSTGLWFADFDFFKYQLSHSASLHSHLFQNRSKQLSAYEPLYDEN